MFGENDSTGPHFIPWRILSILSSLQVLMEIIDDVLNSQLRQGTCCMAVYGPAVPTCAMMLATQFAYNALVLVSFRIHTRNFYFSSHRPRLSHLAGIRAPCIEFSLHRSLAVSLRLYIFVVIICFCFPLSLSVPLSRSLSTSLSMSMSLCIRACSWTRMSCAVCCTTQGNRWCVHAIREPSVQE